MDPGHYTPASKCESYFNINGHQQVKLISKYCARNNFETKTFTLVLLEHFSGKTVPLKLIKKSLKIYKKQLFFSHFFSYLISNGKLSKLV